MKRIATNKLFRKPFTEMAKILYWGDTKYFDSPNEKFYLTFSHFVEPRMCATICLFNLMNKQNKIVENLNH